MNAATGELKWRFMAAKGIWATAAVGNDGTVYVGSHDGNLYALGHGDGKEGTGLEDFKAASSETAPKPPMGSADGSREDEEEGEEEEDAEEEEEEGDKEDL